MAGMIVSVFMILSFLILESAGAETLAVYSGTKITSLDQKMDLETITISREGGDLIAYYGHVGLPLQDCEGEWLCLPLPYFDFAVPSGEIIDIDQSWVYEENNLKVVNSYTQIPVVDEKRVFAIELTDSENKKVALVFWQPSRGVIGFSFWHQGFYFSYHLISPTGMGSTPIKQHNIRRNNHKQR